jgi:hypothetical protein
LLPVLPQMEVAFVVYLDRRSQLGSAALCGVRWLACASIAGRFLHGALQRHLQTGGGSQRDGAQAALLLVLWAACTLEGKLCCMAHAPMATAHAKI